MNTTIAELQKKLQYSYGRGTLVLKKYSPEILLGAGLIGAVVAAVMAAKATLDLEPILEKHMDDMGAIDANMDGDEILKAKTKVFGTTGLAFGKLYGPALGLGVLSISSILASHGVMGRRQVSLIAAYNLLNEGFQSYRNRVIEDHGIGKDLEYKLGLREETKTVKEVNELGETVKVKKHSYSADQNFKSIYARFFDGFNPQYRKESRTMNMAFLQSQQNYANDILNIRGHVFLNEVYERLGFPHTKEGAIVGWVLSSDSKKMQGRDGFIDFGIFDFYNESDGDLPTSTFLLDFNVDGIIFNII